MNFFLFAAYISFFSAFLPTVVGIYRFNKMQKTLRILSVFCIIKVIFVCLGAYLGYNGINNMPVIHIYTPFEFSFFCIIVSTTMSKKFKKILILLAILFTVFCIINAMYLQSIKDFNAIPRGIAGLILICVCSYFFYNLFISENTIDIIRYPFFWLNAALLIYFSGTFFLFIYTS